MKISKLKFKVIFLLVFTSISLVTVYISNQAQTASSSFDFLEKFANFQVERTDGGFYSFVDIESKKEIDRTARGVYEGDEIIIADNSRYEVVKIEDDTVYCKYKGKEDMSWEAPVLSYSGQVAQKKNNSIAFYSTHTAESYVPTSNTDSKPGDGDILKVANQITEKLKEQNVNAIMSDNKHDPHDANAYQRSRRTAAQLLKKQPVAIVDVHRDGVPDPKFYAKEIDGKNATQIRLVVGRQNQNMKSNLDFAKKIKAFYDEKKPGLIKGIFLAKGNYNQDLAPNSILIEVGTHTNSLDAANNGAVAFASLLPEFLGIDNTNNTGQVSKQTKNVTGGGSTSSVLWIVLIAVVGVIGFLLVSTGSFKGSVDKVKGLGKEFSSYLGNIKGKRTK